MDDLLLHDQTRLQLEAFLRQPAQVLLLIAPAGSGKSTIAGALAAELLAVNSEQLYDHPYLFRISAPPGKQEVPIDSVRQLIKDLSLKVPSRKASSISRVVIIDEAHKLSSEAQNALLKLLEEPPAASVILLNVTSESDLLPTVVSRAQKIHITQPDIGQSLEFFKKYPSKAVETSWHLSRGGAGLMSVLLSDTGHPLRQAVDTAKKFLASKPYERLLMLKELAHNPAAFEEFLSAMSLSLSMLQDGSIKRGDHNQKKLLDARRAISNTLEHKAANVNIKLLYLNLSLNFNL